MKKEVYASGVRIIKRKKKFAKLGVFFLSIVCILFMITLSQIFVKTLNIEPVSIFNLFLENNNKIQAHSLYAVTLGEFEDRKKCQDVAMGSSIAGASGFVWEENNKFYAIGSIYKSNIDAEIVAKQIEKSVYNIAIKEIKFKEIKISSDLEKSTSTLIRDSLEYLESLFENYEKTALQLEKGEITYVASASFINAYKSEIKLFLSKFEIELADNNDEMLGKIKLGFVQINEILDNAVNILLSNSSPTSDIKYCLCEFVFYYNSLILSL